MKSILLVGALALLGAPFATPGSDAPLSLQRTIVLSGVTGKFDHFAIDESGNRLFAAATGNHTVEVVDLRTGQVVESLSQLGKPHGVAWVGAMRRLFVADGAKGELDVFEGSPLMLAKKIKLSEDADDMVYDAATQLLYVGHGGTDASNPAAIAVIDAAKLVLLSDLPVGAHPEALELDSKHDRVFANISDTGQVLVIDGATHTVKETWQLTEAKGNTPLAYNADLDLLLVGCRKPSTIVVLNAQTGKEVASAPADAGADDLFYEPGTHRAYLITGSGMVDSYEVSAEGQLRPLKATTTVSGAKTGLLVPSQSALFVGIPGVDTSAQVRMYLTSGK